MSGIENLQATCNSYREQLGHADEALRNAERENAILKERVRGYEGLVKSYRVSRQRERKLLSILERLADR